MKPLQPNQFQVDRCGNPLTPDLRFIDVPCLLPLETSVPANTVLRPLKRYIETDAWFFWSGLAQWDGFTASASTSVLVRFQAPDGYYLSNARIRLFAYFGIGQRQMGLDPPVACPPGSTIDVELENDSGLEEPVLIAFVGYKRYFFEDEPLALPEFPKLPARLFGPNQNVLSPDWMRDTNCPPETPVGMVDVPQDLPLLINGSSSIPSLSGLKIQIPGDGNTFFVLREIHFTQTGNDSNATATIQIKDPDGNYLSDDFLRLQDLAGPVQPELVVRAGRYFLVDVRWEDIGGPGSWTTQLVLRGVSRR